MQDRVPQITDVDVTVWQLIRWLVKFAAAQLFIFLFVGAVVVAIVAFLVALGVMTAPSRPGLGL